MKFTILFYIFHFPQQITELKQGILDRDQTVTQLRQDMIESQHQYTACYDEVYIVLVIQSFSNSNSKFEWAIPFIAMW